jgi:homospermidine synthase
LNTVAFSADWVGNVNSQFGVAANWQGGTFAAGIANARAENFYILNESLSALRYTEADGETIVGVPDGKAGQFVVGLADRSGRLEISGGALRIYSYWSAIVAQLGTNTVGTIHVSGGVLRISNTSRTLDKERFFRVGNTASAKQSAKGAIFLSGGGADRRMRGWSRGGPSGVFGAFSGGWFEHRSVWRKRIGIYHWWCLARH